MASRKENGKSYEKTGENKELTVGTAQPGKCLCTLKAVVRIDLLQGATLSKHLKRVGGGEQHSGWREQLVQRPCGQGVPGVSLGNNQEARVAGGNQGKAVSMRSELGLVRNV